MQQRLYSTCPRCSYILSYQEKGWSIPPPFEPFCRHPGVDALFLSLLLQQRTLFSHFFKLRYPGSLNPIPQHTRIWPFPFFSSIDRLFEYTTWTDTVFTSLKNKLSYMSDDEVLGYITPSLSKVGVRWISKTKGFGTVALEPILKNERLGIYTGLIRPFSWSEKTTHKYVVSIPSPLSSLFSFLPPKWVIDAIESGSTMRYCNHDDEPNAGQDLIFWRDILLVVITACRDISKKEEIVVNYGESYWQSKK